MQRAVDDEFDILIIADNPSLEVLPTTYNKPWALQRLGGFTLLDFCLEWVCWFDSPNVVVATSTIPPEVCQQTEDRWDRLYGNNLRFVRFEDCTNVNDLLREVESRQLITRDFILIDNVATFCSSNLAAQLPAFKSRLRQNRNNVMTLLYTSDPSRDCPLIGIQNYTNKLMLYNSNTDDVVRVSKGLFVADTTLRTDLAPCGIALCAREFASGHFSGNYDFQTFDRIIYDVLSNEEFLGQTIHIEVLSHVHAFSANNYPSLLRAQSLLLRRVGFPLTFENILPYFDDFDKPARVEDRNVCVPEGKEPPCGDAVRDAVFGRGFLVHETATVALCTFGVNARVGKNSTVRNSIYGDSVNLGENAIVEESILESGVVVGIGAHVKKCCYIGANVNIPPGTIVAGGSVLQSTPPPPDLLRRYLSGAEAESGASWKLCHEKVNDYYSWWLQKGKSGRRLSVWYLYSSPATVATAADDGSGGRKSSECGGRQRQDSSHSQSSAGGRRRPHSSLLTVTGSDGDDDDEEERPGTGGGAQAGVYQSNAERFFEEVFETMSGVAQATDGRVGDAGQLDKMKLEINASRLTNNVTIDEAAKSIFSAFLNLPGVSGSFAKLKALFDEWASVWTNYYKRNSSKLQMLHAVEELAAEDENFRRMVPRLVKYLYDEYDDEFLPESVILDWYKGIAIDAPLTAPLAPLIDWLRNAEEESSSDEED